ncbi:hypothetical protein ERO13_A09G145700v2 [Gossypium hirsutum]|uniref:Gag1-like clamp domain-containing protein n=5 Tax=Gossypium TaxID=3633 RepID=A0ABM2YQ47_GOSHI|nr:uncharacterized protein LOC121206193 [Gossypium hirsutum]XP_040932649.1 uncharacterized protein LOC121206193 [Gossypium hirsutum]XP_040932650.1 uncharacterized protein LOC121206193 [Gossypium hirsutum]XP_040932651.1 uncharacterized protein LOC121206193 [Gossypium hirsutum]XP_040932652.1 uncharacterized protein LOC121206193 [Gossypium hirsutum]XP_040932653.1 uncharacterized protein LOC121206193 [Gossypium hirsutum]XP_040932654.1 uncharacterized protein LOC121206193 [Gossypium hirsutum]XP_0
METNGTNHHSRENRPSTGSNNANRGQSTEKEVFVNQAQMTWHEVRRQWAGDQSQKSKRMPWEPIMSWTTTYEDLLCSTERFQQAIPLAEMVDFLVDTWHEEGLYD